MKNTTDEASEIVVQLHLSAGHDEDRHQYVGTATCATGSVMEAASAIGIEAARGLVRIFGIVPARHTAKVLASALDAYEEEADSLRKRKL